MNLARALLGSARRGFRGHRGWTCAAALAGAALLALPHAADAQGTTYVGDDGAQGDVIVNMDALDGAPASPGGRRGTTGGGDPDFAGELVEGPSGVVLRYPPDSPPRSRLTVDPDRLGGGESADRGRTPDMQPPAEQPQRTDRGEQPDRPDPSQTRTMASLPPKPSPPPGERAQWARAAQREAQATQTAAAAPADDTGTDSAGAPDAPATGGTGTDSAGADDTATGGGTQSARADIPEPPESARDTADATAGETAEPVPQRTPGRKPEPPADGGTQMAEADTGAGTGGQPDARAGAGATSGGADSGDGAATDDGAATGAEPTQADGGASSDAAEPEPAGDAQPGAGQGSDGGTQVARLPEDGLPDRLRLDFAGGSAELSPATETTLEQLAQRLKDRPEQRIQLKAFAAAEGDNASRARRMSLSRALAVRSYLIDQGIRSTRMDVRALGNTADQGPLDRVDIVPATR